MMLSTMDTTNNIYDIEDTPIKFLDQEFLNMTHDFEENEQKNLARNTFTARARAARRYKERSMRDYMNDVNHFSTTDYPHMIRATPFEFNKLVQKLKTELDHAGYTSSSSVTLPDYVFEAVIQEYVLGFGIMNIYKAHRIWKTYSKFSDGNFNLPRTGTQPKKGVRVRRTLVKYLRQHDDLMLRKAHCTKLLVEEQAFSFINHITNRVKTNVQTVIDEVAKEGGEQFGKSAATSFAGQLKSEVASVISSLPKKMMEWWTRLSDFVKRHFTYIILVSLVLAIYGSSTFMSLRAILFPSLYDIPEDEIDEDEVDEQAGGDENGFANWFKLTWLYKMCSDIRPVPWSDISKKMHSLSNISIDLKNITTFGNSCFLAFKKILDLAYEVITGMPYFQDSKLAKQGAKDLDLLNDMTTSYTPALAGTPEWAKNYMNTYTAVMKYYGSLKLISTNSTALQSVSKALTTGMSIFRHCEATTSTSAGRVEPVAVYVSGAPHTGKSKMTDLISECILKQVWNIDDGISAHIYTRNPEDDFWSGYANQKIVKYDDVFQVKDVKIRMAEALSIIRARNTAGFTLNMADLSDKGRTHFDSPLILLTSNTDLKDLHDLGINSEEALRRRMDFEIKMIQGPKVAKDDVSADDAKVYKFNMIVRKNGKPIDLGVKTFKDLVKAIAKLLTLRESLFKNGMGKKQDWSGFFDSDDSSSDDDSGPDSDPDSPDYDDDDTNNQATEVPLKKPKKPKRPIDGSEPEPHIFKTEERRIVIGNKVHTVTINHTADKKYVATTLPLMTLDELYAFLASNTDLRPSELGAQIFDDPIQFVAPGGCRSLAFAEFAALPFVQQAAIFNTTINLRVNGSCPFDKTPLKYLKALPVQYTDGVRMVDVSEIYQMTHDAQTKLLFKIFLGVAVTEQGNGFNRMKKRCMGSKLKEEDALDKFLTYEVNRIQSGYIFGKVNEGYNSADFTPRNKFRTKMDMLSYTMMKFPHYNTIFVKGTPHFIGKLSEVRNLIDRARPPTYQLPYMNPENVFARFLERIKQVYNINVTTVTDLDILPSHSKDTVLTMVHSGFAFHPGFVKHMELAKPCEWSLFESYPCIPWQWDPLYKSVIYPNQPVPLPAEIMKMFPKLVELPSYIVVNPYWPTYIEDYLGKECSVYLSNFLFGNDKYCNSSVTSSSFTNYVNSWVQVVNDPSFTLVANALIRRIDRRHENEIVNVGLESAYGVFALGVSIAAFTLILKTTLGFIRSMFPIKDEKFVEEHSGDKYLQRLQRNALKKVSVVKKEIVEAQGKDENAMNLCKLLQTNNMYVANVIHGDRESEVYVMGLKSNVYVMVAHSFLQNGEPPKEIDIFIDKRHGGRRTVTVKHYKEFPELDLVLFTPSELAPIKDITGQLSREAISEEINSVFRLHFSNPVLAVQSSKVEPVKQKPITSRSTGRNYASCLYAQGLEGVRGDCGLPYIIFNTSFEKKLLGLHVAGSPHLSIIAPLSLEMVESYEQIYVPDMIEAMNEDDITGILPEEYYVEDQIGESFHDSMRMIGTIRNSNDEIVVFSNNPRSKLIPTPLVTGMLTPNGKFIKPPFEVEKRPARLGIFIDPKTNEVIDPMMVSLKKLEGKWMPPLPPFATQESTWGSMLSSLRDPTWKYKPLTIEEACFGGKEIPGIDFSTSPGSVRTTMRQTRRQLINPEQKTINEQVREMVEHREERAHKNLIVPALFTGLLKDEPRPLDRVASGSTRMYFNGELDHFLFCRRYWLPIMLKIEKDRFNVCQVGINVFSADWKILYDRITKFGIGIENIIVDDVSGWDLNFSNWFAQLIVWYLWQFKIVTDISHLRCLYSSAASTLNPIINIEGYLHRTHLMPSGGLLTSFLNTVYNEFKILTIFNILCKKHLDRSLESSKYMENGMFGDDNITAINPEILDWFNGQTIAEAAKFYFHHVHTSPDKSPEIKKGVKIEDAVFLQRRFKLIDGIVACPIEESSIKTSIQWIMKSKESFNKVFTQNCHNAAKEMALHGKNKYVAFKDTLNEFLTNMKLPLITADFETVIDDFKSTNTNN